jgi:hypothetical protein
MTKRNFFFPISTIHTKVGRGFLWAHIGFWALALTTVSILYAVEQEKYLIYPHSYLMVLGLSFVLVGSHIVLFESGPELADHGYTALPGGSLLSSPPRHEDHLTLLSSLPATTPAGASDGGNNNSNKNINNDNNTSGGVAVSDVRTSRTDSRGSVDTPQHGLVGGQFDPVAARVAKRVAQWWVWDLLPKRFVLHSVILSGWIILLVELFLSDPYADAGRGGGSGKRFGWVGLFITPSVTAYGVHLVKVYAPHSVWAPVAVLFLGTQSVLLVLLAFGGVAYWIAFFSTAFVLVLLAARKSSCTSTDPKKKEISLNEAVISTYHTSQAASPLIGPAKQTV